MKKIKYNVICTLAVILIFIMAFQTVSFAIVEVYEDVKKSKDFLTDENTIIDDDVQQDIVNYTSNSLEDKVIVAEDESLRKENERHFICDDGTRIVASYPEQVCYQEDDGTWETIDNSLLLSGDRITNKKQGMQVSFSTESHSDKMVSLDYNDIELSWSVEFNANENSDTIQDRFNTLEEIEFNVIDTAIASNFNEEIENSSKNNSKEDMSIKNQKVDKRNNVKAVIKELEESTTLKESSYEQFVLSENLTSTLIYTDIYSDTIDASYTVLPNKIKENIVLTEKTDIESYSMNIICETLTAEITDDNSIIFSDVDGNVQYIIQTPYMYDNIYEISYDIKINIEKTEDGYKITFSPDLNWLNSEDREYPITIDPTVRTSTDKAHFSDTYVYEGCSASDSRRYEERLRVGIYSDKIYRAFWKAETLPTLPDNTIITNASYVLKFYDCTTSGNFRLFGVNGSWKSNTITWDNADSCTYTLLQSNVARNTSTQTLTFNGSKLVERLNSWYNGTSNDGFLICYYDESGTNPDYNLFYSSDNTTSDSYKPYLLMEYQTGYTASNLMIYQSPNDVMYDSNLKLPNDLDCGDDTKEYILSLNHFEEDDFSYSVASHRENWEELAEWTSMGQLETVALDMIGYFMSGDGGTYTNSTLTSEIVAHDSTQDYILGIKECLENNLENYNGNIYQLEYLGDYVNNRNAHPVVKYFLSNDILQPCFDSAGDVVQGLTFCMDNPWGNQIWIDWYKCIGNSYSGRFTVYIYDHFGIDEEDIGRKYKGIIPYGGFQGFRSWFILQHYEAYNKNYKPYVSYVSFSIDFSGTI